MRVLRADLNNDRIIDRCLTFGIYHIRWETVISGLSVGPATMPAAKSDILCMFGVIRPRDAAAVRLNDPFVNTGIGGGKEQVVGNGEV